jgi:hypothetical protein
MAGDPTVGDNTVADHEPSGITRADSATLPLAGDGPPEPAALARVAAKQMAQRAPLQPRTRSSSLSLSNAADALRDEEIERTRLFMIVGWLVSVVAMGTLPFVDASRISATIFVAALVIGMIVSAVLYRRFADPARYTERALHGLALMCMFNGHIAVWFYGPFTAAPVVIVVGIHFVARTELERVAKSIVFWATVSYGAMAGDHRGRARRRHVCPRASLRAWCIGGGDAVRARGVLVRVLHRAHVPGRVVDVDRRAAARDAAGVAA